MPKKGISENGVPRGGYQCRRRSCCCLVGLFLAVLFHGSVPSRAALQSPSRFLGHRLSSALLQRPAGSLRSKPGGTAAVVMGTMKIRIGILGLPNVGKSSLFNALARQQDLAEAANYPFCTIDPNVATVPLADPILAGLGRLAGSLRTVPAVMEFVDVAGLARGAHRGEGLGNQFLGTLRDCQALCHVVRWFDDPSVVHVEGRVDPATDVDAVHLELLLADLAHVERRLERANVSNGERAALERAARGLHLGKPARLLGLEEEELLAIRSMGLLTLKPVMYAVNVDEADYLFDRDSLMQRIPSALSQIEWFDETREVWTIVSARLESELLALSEEEQNEYLNDLMGTGRNGGANDVETIRRGLSHMALPHLARQLLGYSIVYTGPGLPPNRSKTTRAHWIRPGHGGDGEAGPLPKEAATRHAAKAAAAAANPVSGSTTADDLAGRIHGDIQRGFLRAEVISAPSLLECESYVAAKESGLVRIEGRDYCLQPNDVVLIKWKPS